MPTLRVVGDVHGQLDADSLLTPGRRPYLDLTADAPASVQVGDMGDAETYAGLRGRVDAGRHRFFPGNHDHYPHLPEHCLGDFGPAAVGGVPFFFARGAESADKAKLVALGRELGKTLWSEQEELTDDQMRAAERAYRDARPAVVLTHDAPSDVARFVRAAKARAGGRPDPPFRPSRTNRLLDRLLAAHRPRAWLFGHHHVDWRYREDDTLFVCVGELSAVEVGPDGTVSDPPP